MAPYPKNLLKSIKRGLEIMNVPPVGEENNGTSKFIKYLMEGDERILVMLTVITMLCVGEPRLKSALEGAIELMQTQLLDLLKRGK